MPHDADTVTAQLQLMFYHRLLSLLMSRSSSPFAEYWENVGLLSNQPFSREFRREAGLSHDVNCLEDVQRMFVNTVEMLNIQGVDDSLQIIYRTQAKPKKVKKEKKTGKAREKTKAKKKVEAMDAEDVGTLSEQERVAAAQASGADPAVDDLESDQDSTYIPSKATGSDHTMLTDATSSLEPPTAPTMSDTDSTSGSDSEPILDEVQILGMKTFQVNSSWLDNYLSSVLELWYGKRPPAGVQIEQTNRCR